MAKTVEQIKDLEPADGMQGIKGLFFEICTSFINLPSERIDSVINKKLRRMGEFWNFDAMVLAELSDDGKKMQNRHFYIASGVDRSPAAIKAGHMPWLMAQLYGGATVTFNRLPNELPEDATEDKAFFLERGIQSIFALPFKIGETIRGGLIVLSFQQGCSWPKPLFKELGYISEVFASAMDRKRAAERIAEVGRFERLLSIISATYINLPPQDVDKTMRRDLGRLGKLLDADRCILYLPDESGLKFKPYQHSGWWPEKDHDTVMRMNAWLEKTEGVYDNFNYLYNKWRRGQHFQWTQRDKLPEAGERMKQIHLKLGTKSHLSVPISVVGKTIGALTICDNRRYRSWPEKLVPRLRIFGEVFANALTRKQSEESLYKAFSEIKQLEKQIKADYICLREEIQLEHNFKEIVGNSNILKNILHKVEQVAPTDATVLILGETGTGKELIARALHNASRRSNRPLIKLNCASLAQSLIESELFGHEKGAFTGADSRRVGRFELANGATLLLDEIGEIPLELQPKLLRVLQDGEYERVGGSKTLKTNARIIAATNRDLKQEVDKGRFRSDLYYRLNTFPISIPPLRDRSEDIPPLVKWFVDKFSKKIGRSFSRISQKSMRQLMHYSFPGNIRELKNMIERAVITNIEGKLRIEVPAGQNRLPNGGLTMQEMNREYILNVLRDTRWTIEGPNGAAKLLGLKPSTLRNRMGKLEIRRPVFVPPLPGTS